MRQLEKFDDGVAYMDVSIDEDKLKFVIGITNTSDETIHTNSPMSSWCNLKLKDENGINRIEPKVSVAMVTSWSIEPGETLSRTYRTNTLEEAKKEVNELNLNATKPTYDTEEYTNKQDKSEFMYIPSVCLKKENNITFYVEVDISLDVFSENLSMKFKPTEID